MTLTYVHGALDDGRNDMSTTSIHVRFDRVRALLYDVENIRNRRTAMRQQATYVYTRSGAALITIILATSIGRGRWVSCGTYNNTLEENILPLKRTSCRFTTVGTTGRRTAAKKPGHAGMLSHSRLLELYVQQSLEFFFRIHRPNRKRMATTNPPISRQRHQDRVADQPHVGEVIYNSLCCC